MTDVTRIVKDEMERAVPVPDTLPDDLRPVVDRHFNNLIQLAAALQAAGQDRDMIRMMVARLVASYERDLLAAIEARR